MTRFARAKGSKASNERTPEESTDWKVMKNQLLQKQSEQEDNKNRKELEAKRAANYNAFLAEQKQDPVTVWAEFPGASQKQHTKKVSRSKPTKKKSTYGDSDAVTTNTSSLDTSEADMSQEISKFCDSDPNPTMDAQFEKMTALIEKSLAKEKRSSTGKEGKKSPIKTPKGKKRPMDNNDDDANVSSSGPCIDSSIVVDATNGLKRGKKNKKKIVEEVPTPPVAQEENEALVNTKKKRNKNRKSKDSVENETLNTSANHDADSTTVTSSTEEGNKKKNKKRKKKQNGALEPTSSDQKLDQPRDTKLSGSNNTVTAKPKEMKRRADHSKNEPVNFKRRKNDYDQKQYIVINGVQEELGKFDGFPVRKPEVKRLTELRKDMIKKGIPRQEVERTIKLERRKAEKSLSRLKKTVCFHCRMSGHLLSDCPRLDNSSVVATSGTGICFKCGSTEHTHFECKVVRDMVFKYAHCFICNEQGHIARQCPDNPRGLYPQGGGCRVCGNVTHLKKDCPQFQQKQEDSTITVDTLSQDNLEGLVNIKKTPTAISQRKNKIVKF